MRKINICKKFHHVLFLGVLCVAMAGTVACTGKNASEDPKLVNKDKAEDTLTETKKPYANDNMVYALSGNGTIKQWSLDGTEQQTFSLPNDKYDMDDPDFSLLWVSNNELIWAVDDDETIQKIFSTPIRESETGEDIIEDETKELFTLHDEKPGFIYVGDEEELNLNDVIYVSDDYIIFTAGYDGSFYIYNRETGEPPAKIKDTEGATIPDSAISLSDEALGNSIIFHTGRKPGIASEDSNDFLICQLDNKKTQTIDTRCFRSAAFIADPDRDTVYYQTSDDQSIRKYDCRTKKTKELISEAQFQDCYEKNGLLWDDAYYDDALFLEKDCLYYVKNKKENPVVFSYSLTDGSLTYEKALTETIHSSGYPNPNPSAEYTAQMMRIVGDKLLLYWYDEDDDTYYMCIDIPTATAKSVGEQDAEQIYFRMIGLWDDEGTTGDLKNSGMTAKQGTAASLSIDDQLTCISNNSDIWTIECDSELGDYGLFYAVTDLDHNGKLEIIETRDRQGSGSFSTNYFYQVSADGTTLRPITLAAGSDADIANSIETVYFDKDTSDYYYLAEDYVSGGAGNRGIWYGALVLNNGMITERTYAIGESTWNKKQTDEVWSYYSYKDGKEKKLKKSEFDKDALADDVFAGLEKKKVNISWFTLSKKERASKDAVLEKVTKSYEAFQVK